MFELFPIFWRYIVDWSPLTRITLADKSPTGNLCYIKKYVFDPKYIHPNPVEAF